MEGFLAWLVLTEAKAHVSPAIIQGYEHAFRQELQRVIRRTVNPTLRAEFERMLDCPVRDRRGNCKSFTNYIIGALVKNGIHARYDLEAALAYVVEKMLMDKGENGEGRITVFGGFQERPDYVEGNPLQARFVKYLQFAVNNIRKGKISRLADVEHRPQGTVSIGQGRSRGGDSFGGVSPDQIVARPSHDADLAELVDDLIGLLRRKEAAYPIRLVDLFRAILAGQTQDQQRKTFGDGASRIGRQVIVQTIEDYARSTQNFTLLNMLSRLRSGETPVQRRPAAQAVPRPVLSDQERDYASILAIVDRLGRPVGSADFGKYRRRWLDYPARDAALGHKNRLEDVLARMVKDGALIARQTRQRAFTYSPGPQAGQYRQAAVPV
jgi:hypothetical protein